MQERAGARHNLWMTRAPGGFKRMNFPLNGLVLYLPLWHPELSGATIVSKDLNAYSFAVTSPTWGRTGRTFNGTSDVISTGSIYSYAANASATLIAWINTTSNAEQGIIAIGNVDISIDLDDNRLLTQRNYSAGLARLVNSTYTVPSGVWTCVATTLFGGNVSFFADGLAKDANLACPNDAGTNQLLRVGYGRAGAVAYMNGLIGEAVIYSPAVNFAGYQRFYQTTKWRYL